MINRCPYLIIGRVAFHVEQKAGGPGTARLHIDGMDGNVYPFTGFYGDGIDLSTGNLHGRALIPREGQMVGLLFEEGRTRSPIACFPLPYPTSKYTGNERVYYSEQTIFDIAGGGSYGDIIYSHYKGQRIVQRDDGSTEIQSKEVGGNRTVIMLDANGNVKINLMPGAKIELGQNALQNVVLETLMTTAWNTAWADFLSWANTHEHPTAASGPPSPPSMPATTPVLSGHGSTAIKGQP